MTDPDRINLIVTIGGKLVEKIPLGSVKAPEPARCRHCGKPVPEDEPLCLHCWMPIR